MAKPSTDFERQYRSEVKRIKRSIKGLEERGYVVHYDIPELPKSWRGKFLNELKQVNRSELLRNSTYYDPSEDKWVKGTKGREIERRVTSEKAKLTKAIRKKVPDYTPPKASTHNKKLLADAVDRYKNAYYENEKVYRRVELEDTLKRNYETALLRTQVETIKAFQADNIDYNSYKKIYDSIEHKVRKLDDQNEDIYNDYSYVDEYDYESTPVETSQEVSDVPKYGEPELPPELPPLTPEDVIDTGIDFIDYEVPEPEPEPEPQIAEYETYDPYYEMWRYDTIDENTGELIKQQWVSEDGEIFEDPRDYIPFEQQMFTKFRHGYEHYNEQFVRLLDTALNNARQKVGLNNLMNAIQAMKNTGDAPSFEMAYTEGAVREYLTELGEQLDIDDFGVESLLDAYEADMESDSYSI